MRIHFFVCDECGSRFKSSNAIENIDQVECPTCGQKTLRALKEREDDLSTRARSSCGTGWGGG